MFKEKIAYFVGNWAWLWKVVLFVSFVFSTGIPQYVYSVLSVEQEKINAFDDISSSVNNQEDLRAIQKLAMDFHNKMRFEADSLREAKGYYSPYDYFDQLDKTYCFNDSVGRFVDFYSSVTDLQLMMNEDLRAGKFSSDDIEKAKQMNLERYPDADPNRVIKPIPWNSIGLWFWLHYLYALPLALLWFLVNLIKLSKKEKYSEEAYKLTLSSPLSLILATILYPVYFGWRIIAEMKQEGYRVYTEAELRRRKKKFLTLLSDDEKALVSDLVRRRASLSEIRDVVSAYSGNIVHRGALSAFVATIIVMTISSVSPRLASATCSGNEPMKVECKIDVGSCSCDIDIGVIYDLKDLGRNQFFEWLLISMRIVWPPDFDKFLVGRPPDPTFHIQVSGLTFQAIELLNQKTRKNEKYISIAYDHFESGLFSGSNHS